MPLLTKTRLPLTRTLAGYYRLARPLNAAIMAVGVAIGALLAAGSTVLGGPDAWSLVVAMAAAVTIGVGANAINDVYDAEIDRVNRPSRPLPSGAVTESGARVMWGVVSVVGILLALTLSWVHLVIAIGSVALLYVYSASLKRRAVVGNLVVGGVVALALVFGALDALITGHAAVMPVIAGTSFAFLTTVVREIAKDIEDEPGDARAGARTLPVVAGTRPAAALACVLIAVTLAGLPAARLFDLGRPFLALALPAGGALIAAGWWLLGSITEDSERRTAQAGLASGAMKFAMLAGLAALAVAGG